MRTFFADFMLDSVVVLNSTTPELPDTRLFDDAAAWCCSISSNFLAKLPLNFRLSLRELIMTSFLRLLLPSNLILGLVSSTLRVCDCHC